MLAWIGYSQFITMSCLQALDLSFIDTMSDTQKPRSGKDRRSRDIGAPAGWKERRRSTERRLPEVEEISMEEFNRLMQENSLSPPKQPGSEDDNSFDWNDIRKL